MLVASRTTMNAYLALWNQQPQNLDSEERFWYWFFSKVAEDQIQRVNPSMFNDPDVVPVDQLEEKTMEALAEEMAREILSAVLATQK
jgi:hypothetical protein